MEVEIRVYALTREWNEYHAIREDVFLRVNNIVKASGTRFALPSQTLYMGRDDALDEERSDAAIAEVKSWRRSGRLPFPRLSAAKMNQLEASLDYPPQGSVDAAITKASESEAPEPLSAETDPESSDEAKAQAQANPKPQSAE